MDDVRAELLLSSRGDDLTDISVKKSGRFYRGYMPDLMAEDSISKTIELSRNGLMQMLPEALFYQEEFLRENVTDADTEKTKKEELKTQKQLCSVFFEGFDTIFAQHEIRIHKIIGTTEYERESILLREIYGIEISRERNMLIRKLALLLLESDTIKGNIPLIAFYLRAIMNVKVSYSISTQTMCENKYLGGTQKESKIKSAHYKRVLFILYIEDLSSEEYRNMMDQYEDFFIFLEKWFLPYDCEVDYRIKDYHKRFILGDSLTLDYNTQFLS